jgi:hypothetical protein
MVFGKAYAPRVARSTEDGVTLGPRLHRTAQAHRLAEDINLDVPGVPLGTTPEDPFDRVSDGVGGDERQPHGRAVHDARTPATFGIAASTASRSCQSPSSPSLATWLAVRVDALIDSDTARCVPDASRGT